MSHVEGHITEPPTSLGKLNLAIDGVTELSFVPPPFTLTKGMRVGFHPIYKDAAHTEVMAIDIVLWEDHQTAEVILKSKLPLMFDKLEEIYADSNKRAEVEAQLTTGNLQDKHKDVIKKTLDYFKLKDFVSFYKKGTKYDSAYAEQKIVDTINGVISPLKAKKKK